MMYGYVTNAFGGNGQYTYFVPVTGGYQTLGGVTCFPSW